MKVEMVGINAQQLKRSCSTKVEDLFRCQRTWAPCTHCDHELLCRPNHSNSWSVGHTGSWTMIPKRNSKSKSGQSPDLNLNEVQFGLEVSKDKLQQTSVHGVHWSFSINSVEDLFKRQDDLCYVNRSHVVDVKHRKVFGSVRLPCPLSPGCW